MAEPVELTSAGVIAALRAALDAVPDSNFMTDGERDTVASAMQPTVYDPADKREQVLSIGDVKNDNALASVGAHDLARVANIKAYVDAAALVLQTAIDNLSSSVKQRGLWDASQGTFPDGSAVPGGVTEGGDNYIVSVGGTVDGVVFDVNDQLRALANDASTDTYAGNWHKIDNTDEVVSVAGLVGAISAAGLRAALNVEDGATADMSAGEVLAALLENADTHIVTTAQKAFLNASATLSAFLEARTKITEATSAHKLVFINGGAETEAEKEVLMDWDDFVVLMEAIAGTANPAPHDLGALAGDVTPDFANGSQQYGTVNGASTLKVPTGGKGEMKIELTNGATAAAPNTDAFADFDGAYDTSTAKVNVAEIVVNQSYAYGAWRVFDKPTAYGLVPIAFPDGVPDGLPFLITEASIANSANASAIFAAMQANGQDIRLFSDPGATVEIPHHRLAFDQGTEKLILRGRAAGAIAPAGQVYMRIGFDGAPLTDYAVGDTYGRNAVYAGMLFASDDLTVNFTGGTQPTVFQNGADVNSFGGKAATFLAADDRIDSNINIPDTHTVLATGEFHANNDGMLVYDATTNGYFRFGRKITSGAFNYVRKRVTTGGDWRASALALDTEYRLGVSYDGSVEANDPIMTLDGVDVTPGAPSVAPAGALQDAQTFRFGTVGFSGTQGQVTISELMMWASAKDAAFQIAYQDNIIDPGAFAVAGALGAV